MRRRRDRKALAGGSLAGLDPQGRRRSATLRLAVGWGAAVAAVPYLALKLNWVLGGTVGMADPGVFHTTGYRVANLVTLAMDLGVVLVAVALTHPRGRRLPRWLVLVPACIASGFLAPILLLLPIVVLMAGDATAAGTQPEALRPWVYQVVYGGFAVQGVLLGTAFVLYARDRWAPALHGRHRDTALGPNDARQRRASLVVAALAVAVAGFLVAWASGVPLGRDPTTIREQGAAEALPYLVYAVFALAAAVGLPLLVHRRPRQARVLGPLALTWVGGASMVAWGSWSLISATANPQLAAPAFRVIASVQVVTGFWVAAVMVAVLVERSQRASSSLMPRRASP